jgi:[ribosomal protein S18]-alanine N-acetyltransferase
MNLRDLTQEDAPILAQIHHQVFPKSWSIDEFWSLLNNKGSCGFLALQEDHPIAFIFAQVALDQADILTFCVLPSHRRVGIGRALLIALTDLLTRHDVKDLILEVDHHNNAAINLYQELGFHSIGVRKHYYLDSKGAKSDAIVMAKKLNI